MQEAAARIRDNLDSLVEEYAQLLLDIPDYTSMPNQARLTAARNVVQLVVAGLEAEDQEMFVQFARSVALERVTQGIGIDSVQRAMIALAEVVTPLLTTVETTTFVWQSVTQVHTALSQMAMEKVRAAEQRFRSLADNVAVGVFVHSDGILRYFGREAANTLGYDDVDDLIGSSILDFIHPDERERITDFVRRRAAGEPAPDQYEARLLHRDGSTVDVLVFAMLVEYEGQTAIQGAFVDITERKRVEKELRRLERAIEQTGDGIAVTDVDGNILFVNPAWAEMHGYTVEELPGERFSIFHTAEQLQEQVVPLSQRAIEEGICRTEVGHVRKDGLTFPTRMTSTILEDEEGNSIGFVNTARDITERKRLEQEVRESLERRERQVQASTEIAQEIAAAPALDELFRRVVRLIKERFNYYHVQLFRYEPAAGAARLAAGYGEIGDKLLAEDYRLEMGEGVAGAAAANGQSVLVTDTSCDADWTPTPDLPGTKGELAVPIKWRDEVLGVLDVQSEAAGALTEEDQFLLEGLCGQIAIAIQNTRLRQEMEAHLRELENLTRARSREGWQDFWREAGPIGYLFDQSDVVPAEDFWTPEIGWAAEQQTMAPPMADARPTTVAPLVVRGETIGVLGVQEDMEQPLSLDEQVLVSSVSEQVSRALESARLFAQTQTALAETEALYDGINQMVRTTTVDDMMQALIQSTRLRNMARCSIQIFDRPWGDEPPSTMTVEAVWMRDSSLVDEEINPVGTRYELEQFPSTRLFSRNTPNIVRDIATDERLDENTRALFLDRLGMRSMLIFPLIVGERWIGVFTAQDTAVLGLDEEDIRHVASLIDQSAAVIQSQRLLEQTQQRALWLQTAAEVSRAASSILSLDELLPQVVELIRERFDLYYAGIFLVDEGQQQAVLRAGTGEAGREMLEAGHSLEVGGDSMIGQCTATREAGISLDVGDEAVRFDNPVLPDTRSEMALPLISRDEVVGAMTIQSTNVAAFGERDVTALQTMADQLAIAIGNARLFQEVQASLKEVETVHRRYLKEAWSEYGQRDRRRSLAYEYDHSDVSVVPPLQEPELRRALAENKPVVVTNIDSEAQSALVAPITLRGEAIGAFMFENADRQRDWSSDEIALVEMVSNQVAMALENARLFEQAQQRAYQERQTYEITAKLRRSPDITTVLQAAVDELGQALQTDRAMVRLMVNPDEERRKPDEAE